MFQTCNSNAEEPYGIFKFVKIQKFTEKIDYKKKTRKKTSKQLGHTSISYSILYIKLRKYQHNQTINNNQS